MSIELWETNNGSKGSVLTLRKSELPYIDVIPWGTHFCAHETSEDLLFMLQLPITRLVLRIMILPVGCFEPFSTLEAAVI